MPYTQPSYYPPYFQQSPYMDQLSQLKTTQPYQPMMQPMGQPVSSAGLLWVQGEAGAKSYLVAPNNTVLLMDSESPRFYIKSTDPNGVPSMKIYSYSEVTSVQATSAQIMSSDHVTHEELNSLRDEFRAEMQRMSEMFSKKNEKME